MFAHGVVCQTRKDVGFFPGRGEWSTKYGPPRRAGVPGLPESLVPLRGKLGTLLFSWVSSNSKTYTAVRGSYPCSKPPKDDQSPDGMGQTGAALYPFKTFVTVELLVFLSLSPVASRFK